MAVSVPASLPTVDRAAAGPGGQPGAGAAVRGPAVELAGARQRERAVRRRAARAARTRPPFHVGVLADNVPEFSFLLGGCAFAGAVLVALNPVRRGEALARDVIRTDCQYVLAEPDYAALLPAMDVPVLPLDGLELPAHAPLEAAPATPDDLLMLIFTSGTSGEPKAVRCTHGKIAVPGRMLAGRFGLGTGDTVLRVDADVPLQRDHGGLGGRPGRGRDDRAAPQVLRLRVPPRRPGVRRDLRELRGQAAQLRPGHAGACRRRRQPAPHRLRQRGRAGRPRPGSPSGSAAR